MMLFLQFSFHYTYKYNTFPFQDHFHLILNTVSLQLFSVFYYMQLFDLMLTKFTSYSLIEVTGGGTKELVTVNLNPNAEGEARNLNIYTYN